MTCTFDEFETFPTDVQGEHDEMRLLVKSRSAPDAINSWLQKLHEMLKALTLCDKEVMLRLHSAGDQRWATIVTKRSMLSRQVKTLDLPARKYLSARASKMISLNVNQTRVRPNARETRPVTFAPNNDYSIVSGRKLVFPKMIWVTAEKVLCQMHVVFSLQGQVRLNFEVTGSLKV